MRLRPLLALAAVLVPLSVLPATTSTAAAAPPPAGAISQGVTFVANVPEMKTAISLNFIGDTMFVSTVTGIYAYSVKDPAKPTLLGALPMYIWENEDVEVDSKRGLLFISRDPRGFTTQATPGTFPYGAIHVIDVSLPHAMVQLSLFPLPAGHTTTCVDDCNYTWTGGPSNAVGGPADWKGRPIYGTDMRDPMSPKACPSPIDLGRNGGVTDYAHDVQVDPQGVAWVSGRGGVRGYWTSGKHRDPVDGKLKVATGCAPVPYAGGGTELGKKSGLMHNSWRNPSLRTGGRRGDVLAVTEENLASGCQQSGKFATYDLKGSYAGEGFKPSTIAKHRLRELDSWTPEEQEGANGCESAHYFTDRGDGLVAIAFYGQGTRFLDIKNPSDIKQVGFFRPEDANTWAAYWRPGGYVYVADNARGIDVLKIGKLANTPVKAPALPARSPLNLPDATLGWMCAVPKDVAAHHPSLVL